VCNRGKAIRIGTTNNNTSRECKVVKLGQGQFLKGKAIKECMVLSDITKLKKNANIALHQEKKITKQSYNPLIPVMWKWNIPNRTKQT
jgi:hypothetical protein